MMRTMTVPHRLPAAEHHQDTVVVEHGMVIEQMADQVAELVCQLVDAAEVEGEPGWSDLAVADAVGAIDRLSEVLRAARPELRDVLGPVRRAAAEALTLLEGRTRSRRRPRSSRPKRPVRAGADSVPGGRISGACGPYRYRVSGLSGPLNARA
ncbi:hypothetical protein F3K43_47360 [Streptomyces sp. LBUM 1476]|nr:hypothetical protein [Streptomyces sp. LBUM 1476]